MFSGLFQTAGGKIFECYDPTHTKLATLQILNELVGVMGGMMLTTYHIIRLQQVTG